MDETPEVQAARAWVARLRGVLTAAADAPPHQVARDLLTVEGRVSGPDAGEDWRPARGPYQPTEWRRVVGAALFEATRANGQGLSRAHVAETLGVGIYLVRKYLAELRSDWPADDKRRDEQGIVGGHPDDSRWARNT